MSNSLLSLFDTGKQEIEQFMEEMLKGNLGEGAAGKNFLCVFPSDSLHARYSIEMAIHRLGASFLSLPQDVLESSKDLEVTAAYLEEFFDCLVVYHPSLNFLQRLDSLTKIPVVNLMTKDNHPLEVLGDTFSWVSCDRRIEDIRCLIIGGKGNVVNSWFNMAEIFGFSVVQVCPEGYQVDENIKKSGKVIPLSHLDEIPQDSIKDINLICTDFWTEDEDLLKNFTIDGAFLDKFRNDCYFNPQPASFKGPAVSREAREHSFFWGYSIKKNLIAVNQKILARCFKEKNPREIL